MNEAAPKSMKDKASVPVGKARVTRRRILAGTAWLIGLSAVATGAYAGAIESQSLGVTRYALNPPGWPAGRKLSMTVIADLHAGGPDITLTHVRRVADTASQLKSDLVVLLGDYTAIYRFTNERVPYAVWAGELARIGVPLGTWAILGNHDWWNNVADIRRALTDARIPLLENDAVMLGAEG